jgi:cytochrome c556
MKRLFAGVAAAAILVAGVAYADAISERKALMKSNGASAGALTKMAKGEAPYDAAAVVAAFQTVNDNMKKFGDLFPPGSDKGDTKASPKIWEDMDGFKAEIAKLIAATDAAIAAAPKDKEALGPLLGQAGAVCGECHQKYRLQ